MCVYLSFFPLNMRFLRGLGGGGEGKKGKRRKGNDQVKTRIQS